nr:hypothetical protein [Tanacetum cinerariifolium]
MLSETDYAQDNSNFYGCAKSLDYKVVRVRRNSCEIVIQIYSSESGNWTLCRERFTYFFFVHFDRSINWNDALHWLETKNRDCIGSSRFTIYEMIKGCSVWWSKYIGNTDDFMNPLPEGWSIRYIVWSIVLGEREDDSFLIINLSTKVVQYNLISKTMRDIYDLGSNEIADDYLHGFLPPDAAQIRSLDSPAGLFVNHIRSSFDCDFVSLDPTINPRKYTIGNSFTLGSTEEADKVKILQSCNGLLLCTGSRGHAFDYVYNPSTNLLKILPEPDYANVDSNVYGCARLRLAFDPTKLPYYEVVRAGRTYSDIFIQIVLEEREDDSFLVINFLKRL